MSELLSVEQRRQVLAISVRKKHELRAMRDGLPTSRPPVMSEASWDAFTRAPGAINPLAGGVPLLSANAVLPPRQGVMASPGFGRGIFLRGVHGRKVGGDWPVVSVFKEMT